MAASGLFGVLGATGVRALGGLLGVLGRPGEPADGAAREEGEGVHSKVRSAERARAHRRGGAREHPPRGATRTSPDSPNEDREGSRPGRQPRANRWPPLRLASLRARSCGRHAAREPRRAPSAGPAVGVVGNQHRGRPAALASRRGRLGARGRATVPGRVGEPGVLPSLGGAVARPPASPGPGAAARGRGPGRGGPRRRFGRLTYAASLGIAVHAALHAPPRRRAHSGAVHEPGRALRARRSAAPRAVRVLESGPGPRGPGFSRYGGTAAHGVPQLWAADPPRGAGQGGPGDAGVDARPGGGRGGGGHAVHAESVVPVRLRSRVGAPVHARGLAGPQGARAADTGPAEVGRGPGLVRSRNRGAGGSRERRRDSGDVRARGAGLRRPPPQGLSRPQRTSAEFAAARGDGFVRGARGRAGAGVGTAGGDGAVGQGSQVVGREPAEPSAHAHTTRQAAEPDGRAVGPHGGGGLRGGPGVPGPEARGGGGGGGHAAGAVAAVREAPQRLADAPAHPGAPVGALPRGHGWPPAACVPSAAVGTQPPLLPVRVAEPGAAAPGRRGYGSRRQRPPGPAGLRPRRASRRHLTEAPSAGT